MTDTTRKEPGIPAEGKTVELSGNLKLNPAFFAGKLPEPPEKYNPSKAFRWMGVITKVIFFGAIVAVVVSIISILFNSVK